MEYRLKRSNIGNLQAEDLYNYHVEQRKNVFTKFFAWCEAQENNRFLWLAITVLAMLPLTAVAIAFLSGNNLILWIIMAAVNIPALVLNLAALSTKITLPFLFFGWLTQAVIIAYCLMFALMN